MRSGTTSYDFMFVIPNPDSPDLKDDLREKVRRWLPDIEQSLRNARLDVDKQLSVDQDQIFLLAGAADELMEQFADKLKILMRVKPDEGFTHSRRYLPFELAFKERYEMEEEGRFFGPANRQKILMSMFSASRSTSGQVGGCGLPLKRLKNMGVVIRLIPLHDELRRQHLLENWGRFRRLLDTQPLIDIRNYFGEKITMYFAWIGHYTYWLVIPTILGLITGIFGMAKRGPDGEPAWDNVLTPFFSAAVIIWATIWNELWKRHSVSLAADWGMLDFEETEELREEFKSERREVIIKPQDKEYRVQVPIRVRRRRGEDGVDHLYENYYPTIKRWCTYLLSIPLIFVLVAGVCVSVYFTLTFRDDKNAEYGGDLPFALSLGLAFLNAGIIVVFGNIYKWLAVKLNDLENYRTNTEYENSLIIKTFTFQFVNSYLPLFFIAFLSTKTTNPSRIQDLFAQLLVILLLKQIIGNILELLIPYLKTCLARRKDLANARKMGEENVELSQLDRENSLEPYETPFDDYLQIAIQFGYMSMFASVFPFGPLLSLVNNWFEIRLDAIKLLRGSQRPVSDGAENIGSWQSVMEAIVFASIITNSGIISFVSTTLFTDVFGIANPSNFDRRLTFVIVEHLLILLMLFLKYLVPDMPGDVAKERALEKYFQEEEFKKKLGLVEDDEVSDEEDDIEGPRGPGGQVHPHQRPHASPLGY